MRGKILVEFSQKPSWGWEAGEEPPTLSKQRLVVYTWAVRFSALTHYSVPVSTNLVPQVSENLNGLTRVLQKVFFFCLLAAATKFVQLCHQLSFWHTHLLPRNFAAKSAPITNQINQTESLAESMFPRGFPEAINYFQSSNLTKPVV